MTPPTRQWGPLPRTPPKQQAKRSLAVKGSPTGPREAVCRARTLRSEV